MKARLFNNDIPREGYVSLLAITFAFGLASLGTAVAVSVRVYLGAAIHQEHDILDRIALESATSQTLGEISAAGRLPPPSGPVRVGGAMLEWSLPGEKIDPALDSAADIEIALQAAGVHADPSALTVALATGSLTGFSSRQKLSARQEDALRRHLTFGRAPSPRRPTDRRADQPLSPGAQVDVRTTIVRGGQQRVLWIRARLSRSEGQPWRVHDYRLLGLQQANIITKDFDRSLSN